MSSETVIAEPQPGDEYEEWFNVMKKEIQNESKNKFINISFDELINEFSPILIPLKGENYKSVITSSFYTSLSGQFEDNRYTLGRKKYDFRIPLLAMLEAGFGKKELQIFFRRTILGLGKTYIEPDSYNPEQFVGKIIIPDYSKNNMEYKKSYGFLSKDMVLIDDGYELLTSKYNKHTDTLKYIRKALDPIGNNAITKSRVDALQEQILYYPHCNIVLLTQPIYKVDEKLLMHGTLRRFNIEIPTISKTEHSDARMASEFGAELSDNHFQEDEKTYWKKWLQLNSYLQKRRQLKFTGTNISEIIDEYINSILDAIQISISRESKKYVESIEFNLKHLIFKMATIRATLETPEDIVPIEKHHLHGAIEDHKLKWNHEVLWVSQQMELKSGQPPGWKDSVHGWILKKLYKEIQDTGSDYYKSELVDRYLRKYENVYTINTLKQYIYDGMKDLRRWQMICEYIETPANDKKIKITEAGVQYL